MCCLYGVHNNNKTPNLGAASKFRFPIGCSFSSTELPPVLIPPFSKTSSRSAEDPLFPQFLRGNIIPKWHLGSGFLRGVICFVCEKPLDWFGAAGYGRSLGFTYFSLAGAEETEGTNLIRSSRRNTKETFLRWLGFFSFTRVHSGHRKASSR